MRAISAVTEGLYWRRQTQWGRRDRSHGCNRWDDWDGDAQDAAGTPVMGTPAIKPVMKVRPLAIASGTPVATMVTTKHRRVRIDFVQGVEADERQSSFWETACDIWTDSVGSAARLELMYNLSLSEIRARKGSYALSFCSICVVVFVCVVMLSILSSFAMVGVRLGEASYGPLDLYITPGGAAARAASLNYTLLSQIFNSMPDAYHRHSFRIQLRARAVARSMCSLRNLPAKALWFAEVDRETEGYKAVDPRCWGHLETERPASTPVADANFSSHTCLVCQDTCLSQYCSQVSENVVLTVVEPQTYLGFQQSTSFAASEWMKHPPLGSVGISSAISEALQLNVGDSLLAVATVDESLRHVFHGLTDPAVTNPNVLFSVTVGVVLENALDLDTSENALFFPASQFPSLLADAMAPTVSIEDRLRVRAAKPGEYATSVVLQMPPALRQRVYLETDYRRILAGVEEWGAMVPKRLGANQISLRTPLLSFLKKMEYFTSFVGLIIFIVVLVLMLLSVLLIYTLLTIGIEAKTYDLGIQRMLGFRRPHLALLVLTNTYLFALPACVAGVMMGQLGYLLSRAALYRLTAIPLPLFLSVRAVGWAVLVGLCVPLLAATLPILSLLWKSLPDALNTSRGRGSGLVYEVRRGRSREVDGILFGLGFLGFLSGLSLYYYFPNSMLSMNLPLLFSIMFAVLLGMLSGLVLLASNFQRVAETALTRILLCSETAAVRSMVKSSLSAHRQRNRTTALLYALSVAFIIFITVAFQIQVRSLEYSTLREMGGDVTAYIDSSERPAFHDTPAYASVKTHDNSTGVVYVYEETSPKTENLFGMTGVGAGLYMEDLAALDRALHDTFGEEVIADIAYRFHTVGSRSTYPVRGVRARTIGYTHTFAPSINPVSPNFYDVVNSHFVMVNRYNSDVGRYGLAAALYSENGLYQTILATTTNRVFALHNSSTPFLIETMVTTLSEGQRTTTEASDTLDTRRVVRTSAAAAVMDSSPVFLMTKFPNNMGELLISLPAAARLSGMPYLSVNVLSVSAMFLRLRSPQDYGAVTTFLRQWLLSKRLQFRVRDVQSALSDVRTASNLFDIFFIVTLLTILLICFFSLTGNMTNNVLNSSKELGILICLGMSRSQVYRIFFWEAFVLVLTAGSLGLLIGTTLAVTMLMQSALFTQLYVPFEFPYAQLCIIVSVGATSALVSSTSPVSYLLRSPSITHILRRVV